MCPRTGNLLSQSARRFPLLTLLAVIAAPVALFGWDTGVVLIVRTRAPRLLADELLVYLIAKGGFAALLCAGLTALRGWSRLGFAGGGAWRYWPVLLPAWFSAAASLHDGLPDGLSDLTLGWLCLGGLIAFGEETVFRGIVIEVLLRHGRRLAIVVSALLFGLMHLTGLATGADPRMVAAQAVFATGLGLTFGWVRLAAGSLWPAIAAHAIMDGIGLAGAGGVGNAMRYEGGTFAAVAATAAFSLAWGIFIASRSLPERHAADTA